MISITYKITELFGASADPTTITLPVPNVSPGAPAPNRASFDTGFPAITFQKITAGGSPPSGKDFNGMFYMLSQYALALQAGVLCTFDADVATAIGGYDEGAVLKKLSGIGLWTNITPGNTSDPDTGGAGWLDGVPQGAGALVDVITAGSHNNLAPAGFDATVAFLDIDISAGDATITGLAGGSDGQQVTITPVNTAGHTLSLTSEDAASSAANRFRLSTTVLLTLNVPQTFKYSTTFGLWVPVN